MKSITNILNLSPTHFVSNIRQQHRSHRPNKNLSDFYRDLTRPYTSDIISETQILLTSLASFMVKERSHGHPTSTSASITKNPSAESFTLSSLHFVSGNAASSILFAFSCRYILMKISANSSYLRIRNWVLVETTLIFRSCISTKVKFLFEKVSIVEIFFGFEQRRFDHFVSIVTLNSIDFLRNMCKRKIGQMSAF